jgi:hypothetical protein
MKKLTTTDVTSLITSLYDTDGVHGRDTLIMAVMTHHGATLNMATKAYGAFAKERGLTTTIVSHKDEAIAFLAEHPDYRTMTHPSDVANAVIDLTDTFGVAESTARDYVKAYCDKQGIEMPNKDPREDIFNHLRANRQLWDEDYDTAKAEFIDYVCGTLGRSRSNANEYVKGMDLHLFLSK